MSGTSEAPGGASPSAASDAKPEVGDAPAAAVDPTAKITELEGQIADLTDRLLRAHAEMDNLRKRAERERIDTQKYAVTKFAGDVLAIGDNLQRARTSIPADAAAGDPALKALVDGVEMTQREFINVLSRHGVKPIAAKGEPFSPHLHQAVMEQQNPDVPAGSIVQVFQDGYTIEDRVLRPSMVVVAKGGFKPVKPVMEPEKTTPASNPEPIRPETTSSDKAPPTEPVRAAAEAAARAAAGDAAHAGGFGKRTTPPGSERSG
jgi:molecular chaperone GrpE